MLDCGYKEQAMDGRKKKFIRLEESSPNSSFTSDAGNMNKGSFSVEGFHHGSNNVTTSFKRGMKRGSERLKSLKKTLRFGGAKGIFSEDLEVSEKKIFDPQDQFLLRMNRLFVISCIIAVSVDPLFFYLPVYDQDSNCLSIDRNLAYISTTMRTLIDSFYLLRVALQFRTAYIAPSSRVFGRGELVIDPAQIANRYLRRHFTVDFLAVLPLPQRAAVSESGPPGERPVKNPSVRQHIHRIPIRNLPAKQGTKALSILPDEPPNIALIFAAGSSLLHWDPGGVELAAVLALKDLIPPSLYGVRGAIVEGDCLTLMDSCAAGLRRGDWSVTVDGEEDFSFLSGFPQLRFQHIGREANRVADFCARFALRGNFVWLDVDSSQTEFAELVRADLDGML